VLKASVTGGQARVPQLIAQKGSHFVDLGFT